MLIILNYIIYKNLKRIMIDIGRQLDIRIFFVLYKQEIIDLDSLTSRIVLGVLNTQSPVIENIPFPEDADSGNGCNNTLVKVMSTILTYNFYQITEIIH